MTRLTRLITLLVAPLVLSATSATARSEKRVRVKIEFEQAEERSREAIEGAAGAVVLGGRFQVPGGLGIMSTETKTRRSASLFTIVQDGGQSTLAIATRVPRRDAEYFFDYARNAGYLRSAVRFEDVGTALRVWASVVEEGRIRVRLTPQVSYLSGGAPGAIDFIDASTDVVVDSGERLVIGAGTTSTNQLTRRILGSARHTREGETTITLTATAE